MIGKINRFETVGVELVVGIVLNVGFDDVVGFGLIVGIELIEGLYVGESKVAAAEAGLLLAEGRGVGRLINAIRIGLRFGFEEGSVTSEDPIGCANELGDSDAIQLGAKLSESCVLGELDIDGPSLG